MRRGGDKKDGRSSGARRRLGLSMKDTISAR